MLGLNVQGRWNNRGDPSLKRCTVTFVPRGGELLATDERHGADPFARYVDARRGEVVKCGAGTTAESCQRG